MPRHSRLPSKCPDDDQAYVELATVIKPHGLDGKVHVELNTDFPEHLPEWSSLEIVDPHGSAPARVESVRGIVGSRCLVKLEGIEDREQAEAIRGHVLRIKRSDVPDLPDGAYYDFQIVGLRVVTTEGRELGPVRNIMRTGANDIYETDEALIPAIGSVIQEIDLDRGLIVIEALEGLLD